MKARQLSVVVLALFAGVFPSQSSRAQEFFVAITGAKQGVFRGESNRKGHEHQIPGRKYDFQVSSPRDTATGQVSGKRQYQPITFQKVWGAATVQLYQAMITNETLTNVTFFFYGPTFEGAPELDFKVTLKNARIVSIHQHVGDSMPDGSLNGLRLEDISLTFQSILIQDRNSSEGDTTQARAGARSKPSRQSAMRTATDRESALLAMLASRSSR